MADLINVKSTVAQAEGFNVEVADSVLLTTRYFPTTEGDKFAGKEVLFDFDSSDLKRGAFISSGYKDGNTVSWIANSVVPPRVGSQDSVDPTDQDRVLFERLCRAQGAEVDRSGAYQDLLNLKATRLARRTDRARELLVAMVLENGRIDFDQDKNATGSDVDSIRCKFYDPAKGANNHYVVAKAWGEADAKPYEDVCNMVRLGIGKGKRYTDLVVGANAWAHLSKDDTFAKFAGNTFHSVGMQLDFGEIEGAQHVSMAVFAGVQLNVIVYSGAFESDEGSKTYINPNAVILISEGVGRTLQGGCTLLNPNSIGYGIENSFVGLTGVHLQSIYKDFNNQKLYLREESRPLPAPRHSVNECDWIYCDCSLAGNADGLVEVAKGVAFTGEKPTGWACTATIAIAGKDVKITAGTGSLYAVRDGKQAEEVKVNSGSITLPIDCDRDAEGKALLMVV